MPMITKQSVKISAVVVGIGPLPARRGFYIGDGSSVTVPDVTQIV